MKGRNLLSGFLAAIITVLLVVSLADGYANSDIEPPYLVSYDLKALNETTFTVGLMAENLRITEIMYNPYNPNTE